MVNWKPENLTEKECEMAKAARIVLSAVEIETMESLADKADINVIRMWEKEMK